MNLKQITLTHSALDLTYRRYDQHSYSVTLWWDNEEEGGDRY